MSEPRTVQMVNGEQWQLNGLIAKWGEPEAADEWESMSDLNDFNITVDCDELLGWAPYTKMIRLENCYQPEDTYYYMVDDVTAYEVAS